MALLTGDQIFIPSDKDLIRHFTTGPSTINIRVTQLGKKLHHHVGLTERNSNRYSISNGGQPVAALVPLKDAALALAVIKSGFAEQIRLLVQDGVSPERRLQALQEIENHLTPGK